MVPAKRTRTAQLFGHLTLVGVIACAPLVLASQSNANPEAEARVAALAPQLTQAMDLPVGVMPSRHIVTTASTATGAYYNPSYVAKLHKRFGEAAVIGVLAHELGHIRRGHRHVGHGPGSGAVPAEELEAETEAGCALARLKIHPHGYLRATAAGITNGARQTSRAAAKAAIQKGLKACTPGPNAVARADAGDTEDGPGLTAPQTESPRLGSAVVPPPASPAPERRVATKKKLKVKVTYRPMAPVLTGERDSVTGRPIVRPGSLNASDMLRD